MKYITTIHQYDWNYILSTFESNIELKSRSFSHKVYEHKDNCIFIFGKKGKYNKQSEWFKQNIDNIINKTLLSESIIPCKNGIFSIVPKVMYKNDNIIKYIDNCTGFNQDFYKNTVGNSVFDSFVGALAYNPDNRYFGFFDFGLVKNIGRPSELRVLKIPEIAGYCITYL